jgi:hypothetical protein
MTGIELQPGLHAKFEKHYNENRENILHQWKFVGPDVVALTATTKVFFN